MDRLHPTTPLLIRVLRIRLLPMEPGRTAGRRRTTLAELAAAAAVRFKVADRSCIRLRFITLQDNHPAEATSHQCHTVATRVARRFRTMRQRISMELLELAAVPMVEAALISRIILQ